MIVPFDEMPGTARIWIYQSDRKLSDQDNGVIANQTDAFLTQWAAHGNPLKSAYKVLHDKFLIISVDEGFNQASGCSIDASVALVRQLEAELKINFFDRTRVCFIVDEEVFDSSLTELKNLISDGKIKEDTLTFNNLVQNVEEMESQWIIPAQDSWLKRYF